MRLLKRRLLIVILAVVATATLLLLGVGRLGPSIPEVAAPEPTPEPLAPPDQAPGVSAALPTPETEPNARVAEAAPPPATVNDGVDDAPAPAVGGAGMIAAIDPETGKLTRPTRAQRASLAEIMATALDRVDAPVEIVALPDGGELVHVGNRFMEYAVARVDSSGRIRTDCVQGEQVEGVLGTAVPASDPAPSARAWVEE